MLYQSEITKFLNDLKKNDTHLKEMQEDNFNTWWNKPQDFEVVRKNSASECPQNAYYYIQTTNRMQHTNNEHKS